ncbi:MAG: hypothetical protein IT423_24490 [Pirellulaceae bacterium]|nr:hypothetical protein [Pirellulaceae bacterium]
MIYPATEKCQNRNPENPAALSCCFNEASNRRHAGDKLNGRWPQNHLPTKETLVKF